MVSSKRNEINLKEINIEHKQIPIDILTEDENYHGIQHIERIFGIFLC